MHIYIYIYIYTYTYIIHIHICIHTYIHIQVPYQAIGVIFRVLFLMCESRRREGEKTGDTEHIQVGACEYEALVKQIVLLNCGVDFSALPAVTPSPHTVQVDIHEFIFQLVLKYTKQYIYGGCRRWVCVLCAFVCVRVCVCVRVRTYLCMRACEIGGGRGVHVIVRVRERACVPI